MVSATMEKEVKTAFALMAHERCAEAITALLPLQFRAHSEHRVTLEERILNNIAACYAEL